MNLQHSKKMYVSPSHILQDNCSYRTQEESELSDPPEEELEVDNGEAMPRVFADLVL